VFLLELGIFIYHLTRIKSMHHLVFSSITGTAGLLSWVVVSLFFASQVMFYTVRRKLTLCIYLSYHLCVCFTISRHAMSFCFFLTNQGGELPIILKMR